MKFGKLVGVMTALSLCAGTLAAQDAGEVEKLKQALQQFQENFRKEQEAHRRAEQEHQRQIEALQKQVDALTRHHAVAGPAKPAPDTSAAAPARAEKKWSPTDPIRVQHGGAYMDIGLVGTFAAGGSTARDIEGGLQLGGHDPNQRGFSVQGVEASFLGAVDPYFRANANILFQIDSGGESRVELEEAYLESTSLPGNFQLRGGQFFTEFGRLNPTHPHSWGFVDSPLVNGRFLGPDGLRNPGARLSWLTPTPFYSELFFGVQNSHGETATSFRSGGFEGPHPLPFGFRKSQNDRGVKRFDDLLLSGRYAVSFDLTDTQVLFGGASAAFGPNASGSGDDSRTQIYGVDLLWKWKPANSHGGFPFVTWQTEAMLRKYKLGAATGDLDGDGLLSANDLADSTGAALATLPGETLTDYGFYSQVQYGFHQGWVAGMRFDYVAGNRGNYEQLGLLVSDGAGGGTAAGSDLFRARRWRVSPNLTWLPSEFSKIRLQYNYDDRAGVGVDHSVWLQFEFVLGAHAAHKY